MARLSCTVLVFVGLLCASLAAAAPCIECKDCQGMQSCYQSCQQTCPKPQVVVNGEACKNYGFLVAGPAEAQKACELTMKYCEGGVQSVQGPAYFPVSLSQCANIAFGTCQNRAMDLSKSPCGQHFSGYKQCTGQQFKNFYTGIVNDGCHQAVSAIQNL